jgi:hypothetical protein
MKRFNNKILLIIFSVLVAAFVLTRLFRSPARESNLDLGALRIDTTNIDQVNILPVADGGKEIKLVKDGKVWKASRDNLSSSADKNRVSTMLAKLAAMKPERIVTRKQQKWNDYNVGDTTGTTVIALSNGIEVARLIIGKDQMSSTFVRKDKEEEVYAVEGSIASSFNQKFNDWRDQTFLRVNVDDIKKITFVYPADSGFVLSKQDKKWLVNDTAADSTAATTYLNKLRLKKIEHFADSFNANTPPDVTMTIDAGTTPLTIKAWQASPPGWILSSDVQPGVYFSDEGNQVSKDIFWGSKQFMK